MLEIKIEKEVRTRLLKWLLVAVSVFSVVSLVAGAGYLETSLPGGLPIGNLITASGLCSATGLSILLTPTGSLLRVVSLGSLFLAASWLPVSIILAGNLSLNFSGWRGSVWVFFSMLVVADAFFVLICVIIGRRRY